MSKVRIWREMLFICFALVSVCLILGAVINHSFKKAEHHSDILRGNTSNALAKHAATHPDRARDPGLFNVKVLGSYPSTLYRQVAEGCELALATDVDQLMNSREEWHQPSLNRVTVTREVRQPRRRNNNNNNTGNSSRQPGTN